MADCVIEVCSDRSRWIGTTEWTNGETIWERFYGKRAAITGPKCSYWATRKSRTKDSWRMSTWSWIREICRICTGRTRRRTFWKRWLLRLKRWCVLTVRRCGDSGRLSARLKAAFGVAGQEDWFHAFSSVQFLHRESPSKPALVHCDVSDRRRLPKPCQNVPVAH